MRFLKIVTAVFICAAAVSSEAQVSPLGYGITPAVPTISAGDINGAAIEAQVEVSDHIRAVVDADRQLNDKVSELHGQAINNAVEHQWRTVDAVKTAEARIDGATANAAPAIAKSIVRASGIAPVPYVAPAATVAPAYPAAPVAYPAAPIEYQAAPIEYQAAPIEYQAAPSIEYQAVEYQAVPIEYQAAPAGYTSYDAIYASPLDYGHVY